MQCPNCGGAELVHETRDMPYTYKGEVNLLQATGDFCLACEEGVFEPKESQRLSDEMLAFMQEP